MPERSTTRRSDVVRWSTREAVGGATGTERRVALSRVVLLAATALALIGTAGVVIAYRSDMAAARERLLGESTVLASPYGAIEYAQGGVGPGVLIVHGAVAGLIKPD